MEVLAFLNLTQVVVLRKGHVCQLLPSPSVMVPPNLMTTNPGPPGFTLPLLCVAFVQDQGAFLCVVDDSNEHMLSVWDCSRGVKLAEIKVRSPHDLEGL